MSASADQDEPGRPFVNLTEQNGDDLFMRCLKNKRDEGCKVRRGRIGYDTTHIQRQPRRHTQGAAGRGTGSGISKQHKL
jgi:hypothetical protein